MSELVIGAQGVSAQQTQPIQPCAPKLEKPCTIEPTSPSKPTPANKKTFPRKRTLARKPATTTVSPGVKGRVSETLIDAGIPDDPAIERMLQPYSARVRALEVVIGRLEGELSKTGIGGGSLGNFVTDGIRAYASAKLGKPVLLAVTNSGGLRKNTIAEGELRARDIFELLPFENALIEIDLTGEQLFKLLGVVTASRDAQSGARIKYRLNAENRPELVSANLLDSQGQEIAIDPKAIYTIVTIDYLLKLGSGSYAILQEGKNARPLGVTIRDAIMDYVKAETSAGRPIKVTSDGRFVQIGPDAPNPETRP
ncbi:MAG: 5'-nucleotidase C-terminal domain-containing protein [Pyrinomonadaceae bacterium]